MSDPVQEKEERLARAQAEARARLLEHAGAAQGRRTRLGRRAGWGIGVVAVCAAVSVALVPALRDDDGGGGSAEPRRTADSVLLAAADAAGRQAESGRYLHTSSRETRLVSAGTAQASFLVVRDLETDRWQAVRPARDASPVWTRRLGARPLTAEDEKTWREAGAPARVAGLPGADRPRIAPNRTAAWKKTETGAGRSGKRAAVGTLGSRPVTLGQLNALPADARGLRDALLTRHQDAAGADLWLFTVSRELLDGSLPVRPEVRAATYRMLAELDGVEPLGSVQDARGRQGTGIALEEPDGERGRVRHVLIVDEGTGRLLETRDVLVEPSPAYARIPAGTVYDSTVYEHEWTDGRPVPPKA
jgi:hypothetical protein